MRPDAARPSLRSALAAATLLGWALHAPPAGAQSFVNFESGQVRPLALSPDGSRLFAVNTPDNRLEVFSVGAGGLTHAESVPVGLEPVAVAARSDAEVWVVNHLSDSVSVVDVSASPPRVVRTLLVGDEPRDIVFAGPGGDRAFVTSAHRGQNGGFDPQLTTPGIGRADVWVFDAANLGATLGGVPLTRITLFGDTPRALAASPDGSTVYAAVFHSGNRTTAVNEQLVCDGGSGAAPCSVFGFSMPGGLPAPNTNFEGIPGPETGLIVAFDEGSGQWRDHLARDWSNAVRFSLPDRDVFAIDASAALPVETASFANVGTILFDMAANPVTGKVYVTNTEANNAVRFEGPGVFGGTTVRGHLHEARITVLDGASAAAHRLNTHIDYATVPSPPGTKEKSLATPVGMAVSSDGTKLWVTAFGSSKVAVLDTADLESGTLVPDAADHVPLSGGGPTGLVLDEPRGRLYVATRFDNSISVVDTAARTELAHVAIHSPEPPEVVDGRPVLYDALFTSSNGEASCSACHVFGDLDNLAWDLGNPDDTVLNNPNPIRLNGPVDPDFHPVKGPMTTQSLRGMAGHGPMHWRGDRTGGNDPGGDSLDENAAFVKFNVAFPGLVGRASELPAQDMQAFADFALSIVYPPNPIRALDNSLTAAQQAGRDVYFGPPTDGGLNCNGCHTLDPALGFFGGDGFSTFEGEPQLFKIAHLRNVYQKVGMFGMARVAGIGSGDNGHKGDQIRGFGLLHDGSIDTTRRFLRAIVFNTTDVQEQNLEQFVLAFDSNLAPIVGQQVTLGSSNAAVAGPRIDLLLQRDDAGECEVVAKGNVGGIQRGAVRLPSGQLRSDRAADPLLSDAQVRAFAATAGQEVTYTCVPPGSGTRIGIDRDLDGYFDRDELDAGSDPADPSSTPVSPTPTPVPTATPTQVPTATPTATPTSAPTATPAPVTPIRASALSLRDDAFVPIDLDRRRLRFRSAPHQGSPSGVTQPAPGSVGDPTSAGASGGGATLTVYNAAGAPQKVVLALPAALWKMVGAAGGPAYVYRDPQRTAGDVTSATLRNGRLTVSGKGPGLYDLAGAPQGSMALRLRLGSASELCAVAAARSPSSSNDTLERFVGTPNTPPPAACPPVP